MLALVLTQAFEKQFCKLPASIQKKAVKQQDIFIQNPLYPSLHTEKLQPKTKELWSIRVDKKYRIVFRYLDNDEVLLLYVGPHDEVYTVVDTW